MMMAIIMFSFGGLELVGITAAEADNPEQSIPKATNQVIYRILIFYVGSLAVLLSLLPWTRVTADTSPFVLIFHELGDTARGERAERRGADGGAFRLQQLRLLQQPYAVRPGPAGQRAKSAAQRR